MTRARLLLVLLLAWLATAGPHAQSYTISPPPFQVVLSNAGLIINNACIWTYAAGTTTPIATYSDSSGTLNSNPIRSDTAGRFTAYLLAGTNYKFVYESPCTPPAHGTVLRTADNISAIPASSGTVDFIGVAGETLTAGQAVYLSDGSGSKIAGELYKADSANPYSSATPIVGIALSTIATSASGSIRLAGSVTGLSSLSVGAIYYVGTSGAITSTAPVTARRVGQADTATSLVVAANPSAGNQLSAEVDDFRLTLTTATPVTTTDVTAATTLYATPYVGNRIALFDTAGVSTILNCPEFSIAVPATTVTLYDVWAYNNSGTCGLELLAWTNDTTRATALTRATTGVYTKTGDLSRRYIGSFRTTGSSGQTEDSFAKRYVWNYANRVSRVMRVIEATDTWTYTTATLRQARATATNQLDFVIGVSEDPIEAAVIGYATNDGGTGSAVVSIGVDSTTVGSTSTLGMIGHIGSDVSQLNASLKLASAVGRHVWVWLEESVTVSGTTTWYGDNGSVILQSGIFGIIKG